MGSRISRLICRNRRNDEHHSERSNDLRGSLDVTSSDGSQRGSSNRKTRSRRTRSRNKEKSGTFNERPWTPGSKTVQTVVHPTEDEWYRLGKTGYPATGPNASVVCKEMTVERALSWLGVVKRKDKRMKEDKTEEEPPRKTVSVVNAYGELVTSNLTTGVSKESIEWFELFMNEYDIDVEHYCNAGTEKVIRLHNGTNTKVDGWCRALNIVFEYHGSFFHGDPDKHDRDKLNGLSKIRFGELYKKTRDRDMDILLSGYNLCTIWSNNSKVYKRKTVRIFMLRRTTRAS